MRRIREAHSEWRGPCERPPLYTKRRWDTEYGLDPLVGEALWALISNFEEGVVRNWRRLSKDDPYGQPNKPVTWRRMREEAPRKAALPRGRVKTH